MTEKLTAYQKRRQKELNITGIKVHKNPSQLCQNLFEWYKAEIKQEQ